MVQRWGKKLAPGLVLVLAVYWAGIFTATHIPPSGAGGTFSHADKLQHFCGYGGLAVLLSGCLMVFGRWTPRNLLWSWLAIAIYGLVDEFTQPFFRRDAELLDWLADMIGGGTGLFGMAIIFGWSDPVAIALAEPAEKVAVPEPNFTKPAETATVGETSQPTA